MEQAVTDSLVEKLRSDVYHVAQDSEFDTGFNEAKRQAIAIVRQHQAEQPSGYSVKRACTCHPDDNPPVPCAMKYAIGACKAAASDNQREISVVAIETAIKNAKPERVIVRQELRQRTGEAIEVLNEKIEFRVTPLQQATAVLEFIQPYLRSSEPVSREAEAVCNCNWHRTGEFVVGHFNCGEAIEKSVKAAKSKDQPVDSSALLSQIEDVLRLKVSTETGEYPPTARMQAKMVLSIPRPSLHHSPALEINDKALETAEKAYNNRADEVDNYGLRYCHEDPLRFAIRAYLAVTPERESIKPNSEDRRAAVDAIADRLEEARTMGLCSTQSHATYAIDAILEHFEIRRRG